MKKTAVLLMIIAVLSKVSGFLRDITLSYFYGATATSDAYIISITITSVLFSLLVLGVSTAYIPMFKQIEYADGPAAASTFTNHLINAIVVLTTGILLIGFSFSHPIVKLFAMGFDGETLELAVAFTKIGLFSLFFTSLTQMYTSYLQSKGKFIIPALIGLPFNVMIMLSIFLSYRWNVMLLAVGSVCAALVQLAFLIPSLRRTNYRYEPIVRFTDKHIKKLAVIVFPIMIGISIDQLNLMVDKTLASTLVEGGVSALTYASRLNDFVQGIFVLSFVSVLFPLISNMAAEKNMEDLKKSIGDVISSVTLIVVPASIGIMILAEPIIRLLYGHGHFDGRAIDMTARALLFYAVGMIGYAYREILNRSFYSLQDSKTPMYNAALAVALNIILNLVLSRFMGISGLALATSISALFCSLLLFIQLLRKVGNFNLKRNIITLGKTILASAVMGLVVFFLNEYLNAGFFPMIKMGIVICAGVTVYFGLLYLLQVKESKWIVRYIKDKLQLFKS